MDLSAGSIIGVVITVLVAWMVWVAILNVAANTKTALINLGSILLGRKGLGRLAGIPDGLGELDNPLPKVDRDKPHLMAYNPVMHSSQPSRMSRFRGVAASLHDTEHEFTPEIDINQIQNLLGPSEDLPYEWIWSITIDVGYPVPAPGVPYPVIPPPSWTMWPSDFAEPQLDLPLYGDRWSSLNPFVIAAYRQEIEKVEWAQRRRSELIALSKQRNSEMLELAGQAKEKYRRAIETQQGVFNLIKAQWQKEAAAYEREALAEIEWRRELMEKICATDEEGLRARIDLALRAIQLPRFVHRESQTKFDLDSGILIHEHRFPDMSEAEWIKVVELKAGATKKPANQNEKKEAAAKLYPSICLRLAAELLRLDTESIVKAVAINGWAEYTEKATGQRRRAYCASLFATSEQVRALNLHALDPVAAFAALKGVVARSLEVTPIAPVIRLDTNDKRFVDAKEVLGGMAEGENLAAMDWEDFEHLCRQLFERAFAASGAEVRVTQASRDQGVDAVIFDPDPLRGGKIVVQAKRYTNTVDVSAVRDLYGTVVNEGAIKGILVTTSHYGPEAYTFAKDKPLTLLDGSQLLGLLEQHGYKFRINLAEAKAML
jgi:restriction system protein